MVLAKIKAIQVILDPTSGFPTGIEGAIFYNSTDNKAYLYNGSEWHPIT